MIDSSFDRAKHELDIKIFKLVIMFELKNKCRLGGIDIFKVDEVRTLKSYVLDSEDCSVN